MMNKKTIEKFQQKLSDLIKEGEAFIQYEKTDGMGFSSFEKKMIDEITSWQLRVKNSINLIFGENSIQNKYLNQNCPEYILDAFDLRKYLGTLSGAYSDLTDGFIYGIEFIISSDFFDSIIQEAKHLNEVGYKDASAVLGRITLEKALKKLAENNGVDSNNKASKINDLLKTEEIYNKPQWRQIQSLLDIGNSAAHGEFQDYNQETVTRMLNEIEHFISYKFIAT